MAEEQQPSKSVRLEPTFDLVGLDYIRALDEQENWTVRNQVVTKEQHNSYIAFAKDILNELVDKLPLPEVAEIITAVTTDEHEYMKQFSDADFQGAVSQFDVDYLERIESSSSSDSNLARESLYVKFDPLVGRPSPDSDHHQRTPGTPVAAATAMGSNLLMLDTPPSINNRIAHDLSKHESEVSASSMCSDLVEVESCDHSDLALGEDVSGLSALSSTPQEANVLKYSEEEVIQLIEAAKSKATEQEQIEQAGGLAALERELANAQEEQEQVMLQVQSCQQNDSLLQFETTLVQQELEMWKSKDLHSEEMESKFIDKHEKVKREISKLEQQRDQVFNDYKSVESSYDDLYQRFLKQKAVLVNMHKSNEAIEQNIARLEGMAKQVRERLLSSCKESEESIDNVNLLYESLKKELGSLLTVEKANFKKVDLQVIGLKREIQATEMEKQDISQICEELLKELGGNQRS